MGRHEIITTGTPTQVAHPWRATARTVAAVVAAIVVALAILIPIVIEVAGPLMPDGWVEFLAAALALVTALITIVTRFMQAAKVQPLLERILLGTGVADEKPPINPVVAYTDQDDGRV